MVLIATHSRVVLFDTGDSWNTRGARLRQLALPALDALAVREIDLLVLPRLDADRAQGAALLAFDRDVRRILVGGGWPSSRLPATPCREGRLAWDAVVLEVFAARRGGSCALRVVAGDRALLLAGDLDAGDERELLSRWPPGFRARRRTWLRNMSPAKPSTPRCGSSVRRRRTRP